MTTLVGIILSDVSSHMIFFVREILILISTSLRLRLCPSTDDHWCEHPEEYPEELVGHIIDRLKKQREGEELIAAFFNPVQGA